MNNTITSGLCCDEPTVTIEWIVRASEFQPRLVVPGPAGGVRHSELSLGGGVIFVGGAHPELGRLSPGTLGGTAQSVCVFVEDPDAHFARASDADYGSRGYSARDPEGHLWYFDNYRPGVYWDAE